MFIDTTDVRVIGQDAELAALYDNYVPQCPQNKRPMPTASSLLRQLAKAEAAMRDAQGAGTVGDAWDRLERYFEQKEAEGTL